MKWLFILLLLANIAYFGWELDKEAHANTLAENTIPVIPADAKELKLLNELDSKPLASFDNAANPVTDQINDSAMISDPASTEKNNIFNRQLKLDQMGFMKELAVSQFANEQSLCVSYGPINGEDAANSLFTWTQNHELLSQKRQAVDTDNELFWVYLTVQADLAQAEAVVNDLKKKGVTDYRLIKRANLNNVISLGLFSSKERVDHRLKEINAKGYKPVVVPYHDPDVKRIYWVDVAFDKGKNDIDNIISDMPSGYDSIPVSCAKIALAPLNP